MLEFTRDRKMMSVLCNRKQIQIMFSKGAPESILLRCTNIMCNDDGSTVHLTSEIRAEIESKFNRFGYLPIDFPSIIFVLKWKFVSLELR